MKRLALALLLHGCVSASDPDAPAACSLGSVPEGFPTTAVGTSVGQTLPDFSVCLAENDGTEHHLYGYLGSVVLISFGTGWCAACQEEAEDFQTLYADYGAQGFVVLMGMGEGWAPASAATSTFIDEWKASFGLTFPVMPDPSSSLAQYYRVGDEGLLPINVIVDRDGVVVHNAAAALPIADARTKIEAALAAAPKLDY